MAVKANSTPKAKGARKPAAAPATTLPLAAPKADTKPTAPEAKPAVPEAKPAVPEAKPAVIAEKPVAAKPVEAPVAAPLAASPQPQPVKAPEKPVAAKPSPDQAATAKAPAAKSPSPVAKAPAPKPPVEKAAEKAPAVVAPAAEKPVAATPAAPAKVETPVSAPAPKAETPAPLAQPAPAKAELAKPAPAEPKPAISTAKPKEYAMTTLPTFDMPEAFKTAFADFQEKAKAAYEKGTASVADYSEFAKGNVEALVEAGKILTAGLQEMSTALVADSREAFEAMTAEVKTLAGAKTPTDFVQIQSDLLKKHFDKSVAFASKQSEATLKLASETIAPISGRVSLAVEKVKAAA
jgi:hypothetical protein